MVEKIDIRRATEADVPLILALIKDLAAYERLSDAVVATEDVLRESLFGTRPYAEVILGYYDGTPAGYVLFFHNFSTFIGKPGIYIEDIYVKTSHRGKGLGKALFGYTAALAADRNCARLEFAVLDWNEPSIRFYKHRGARLLDDWSMYRITGQALQDLADANDFPIPRGCPAEDGVRS